MRACCNKAEDNFITYNQSREKHIDRVRDWEKLNPEKRKEYTIKYYKTEIGHRKRLAQQKRYREKRKLIKENEKLKKDKMELLRKVDVLEQKNQQLKVDLKETGNNATWWNNRFNAVSKQNKLYKSVLDEIREYIKDKIYSIEPKGTGINYDCEYDSEEDFISAMEERSRLNTLKEVLQILDKVKE